jgi:hypothetical protein
VTRRGAQTIADPAASEILYCRRCRRPLDPARRVYCSTSCLEGDDSQATRLAMSVAAHQAELEQRRAEVEAEIQRYGSEARRVLRDQEDNAARLAAELAPLAANLADARAAREVNWVLAYDTANSPAARFA